MALGKNRSMRVVWAWGRSFGSTVAIGAKQVFDGNLLIVAGRYAVQFFELLVLTLVWRSMAEARLDLGGMTLQQLLTYSLMASVCRRQLDILTPATSALWEGSIIGRYTRPFPVIASLVAETVGRFWVPGFFFYSLPLLLLCSPVLGISPLPASGVRALLALLSLSLSVCIGFALDFLFAAFAMYLKNGCWAATQVREAAASLLSGAFIPFALMPEKARLILSLLPFGSVANAPLSIYVGSGKVAELLLLQLFWVVVLWAAAVPVFRKSEERMVSFGG